jgi:hypothetical protein
VSEKYIAFSATKIVGKNLSKIFQKFGKNMSKIWQNGWQKRQKIVKNHSILSSTYMKKNLLGIFILKIFHKMYQNRPYLCRYLHLGGFRPNCEICT